MLYPQGSKTNSSMSEPGSRSAMPLLTVVCSLTQSWLPCRTARPAKNTGNQQHERQHLVRQSPWIYFALA